MQVGATLSMNVEPFVDLEVNESTTFLLEKKNGIRLDITVLVLAKTNAEITLLVQAIKELPNKNEIN